VFITRNILIALIAVAAALLGCDRDTPRAIVATQPAAPVLELDMKPLTPLLPNRPTHATVDHLGNVYWVQETDRADDTLFVIGEGGVPRAMQLSVANLGALMGASDVKGNIHGIAATTGRDRNIYFYFLGESGRRTVACVGTFEPRSERLRILMDGDAVAAATGMGKSLPLARASVASDGRTVWIWLRHTDNWAVFRIDPTRIATSGPARLERAFDAVTLDGKPVDMTRDDAEIAAAPDGGLFLLDPTGAQLLRIGPDGKASVVRSLIGLPTILSTPAVDKDQNLVLFAANSPDLIGVKKSNPAADAAATPTPLSIVGAANTGGPGLDSTFPAMLIFKPGGVASINRDHMQAYPGFQVFATRLRQLIPFPPEQGWISYDAGSGELLRVKVTENPFP
jgi:hypothetical protein